MKMIDTTGTTTVSFSTIFADDLPANGDYYIQDEWSCHNEDWKEYCGFYIGVGKSRKKSDHLAFGDDKKKVTVESCLTQVNFLVGSSVPRQKR
jgi:hypothetical protein